MMYNSNVQLGLAAESRNHYPIVALNHVMNNPANEGLHKMSQNNYVIYKFTSPSGKSYIGQTCDLKRRIKDHQKENSSCTAFRNSISKYGFDNFKFEILKENLTICESNFFEKKYINEFNTLFPNGYNLVTGGDNRTVSDITRMRISMAQKGVSKPPITEETRLKMSIAQKNKKPMSEETKAKISLTAKIKREKKDIQKENTTTRKLGHSDETKKKLSLANMGKTLSAETRKKISIALSGVQKKTRSVPVSEDTRKKMSASSTGKPKSKSHSEKISIALKNRMPASEETREKMRKSQTGKKQSEETIAKRTASRVATMKKKKEARAVICVGYKAAIEEIKNYAGIE